MPRARAPIIVAALVMVVWGASPAMTKIAARDFSSLEVGVLRTLIAGLVAAPIVLVTRERLPAGRHQPAAAPGVRHLGFVAFPILFSIGQGRTSAMHGGHDPRRAADLHRRLRGAARPRRPARAWVAGSGLALAGEVALVVDPHRRRRRAARPSSATRWWCSRRCWSSIGYVAGARLGQGGYRALAATYWGVIIGALLVLPVLAGTIAADGLPDAGLESWAAIVCGWRS